MQKIIIDTNVLVSALITDSIPFRIVYDFILTDKVELCLSSEILDEYIGVLSRSKFSRFDSFRINADIVLNKMREMAVIYSVDLKLSLLKDSSDNKFLELAVISSADFLITGNTRDFDLVEINTTTILTPREYWENHLPH